MEVRGKSPLCDRDKRSIAEREVSLQIPFVRKGWFWPQSRRLQVDWVSSFPNRSLQGFLLTT